MKKILLLTLCLVVGMSLVYGYDYIGVSKCKMCHKGAAKGEVFEKWQKSLHAKALDTLKAKKEDKNPKCLECHVTGYGAPSGYKIGDPNAANLEGVQCEVCHGPGSGYKSMSIMKDKKQAIANGLIVPTEAMCKKCHNPKSPTFKGFNYTEALKKIDHTYLKKK